MHEWAICGQAWTGSSFSVAGPVVTTYGSGGPAMAATRILEGSGLSALMRLTTSETLSSVPSSADLHVPVSVVPFAAGVRGGRAPPQRWPNSLQRYDASGPSGSLT